MKEFEIWISNLFGENELGLQIIEIFEILNAKIQWVVTNDILSCWKRVSKYWSIFGENELGLNYSNELHYETMKKFIELCCIWSI